MKLKKFKIQDLSRLLRVLSDSKYSKPITTGNVAFQALEALFTMEIRARVLAAPYYAMQSAQDIKITLCRRTKPEFPHNFLRKTVFYGRHELQVIASLKIGTIRFEVLLGS